MSEEKEKERDIVYYPDYEPNKDDDDEMLHIKQSLKCLNSIQLKIFLTYCELGSYAAVARELKVSQVTAKNYIQQLRQKIYDNL